MSEFKFAELLCTRLCHDLTGPIGAIANGAEFLSEEGFDLQGQAVELITSSATQAVARLQFYRKAYGRINEDGEANLAEQKKTTEDFFAGSKVMLDWPDLHTDASGASISYKMSRLLLNMVVIISAGLLRGGTLAVRIDSSAEHITVKVTGTGQTLRWDKEIEETLSGKLPDEALTPKNIQAQFTRHLAEDIAAELVWNISETAIEMVASKATQLFETPAA